MMIDVLKEEKERLESLIREYDRQIKALPIGSISWKKRGNGEYAYRAYREVNTVRFEYLGKRGSEKAETMEESIGKRRELDNKRREAARNLKEIKRMLNAVNETD